MSRSIRNILSRRAAVLRLAATTLAVSLLAAGPAPARPSVEPETVLAESSGVTAETVQQRGMSLRQAIALAQQRYQGRVERAETVSQNGRRVHEIRILGDDGRVRTVHFDADGGGGR